MTPAATPAEAKPADAPVRSRTPLELAVARFVRNRAAMFSLALLILIALACFVGPLLLPNDPTASDWSSISLPPTLAGMHWFGTDELGRDLLARTLVGGRVSLEVGLLGTLVSGLFGVAWGATAGFAGGRTDSVMMRVVDMMYAIPYLLIAILMMTLFGRSFMLVVLTISAFSWLDMARVVRGQTLSLRTREFVDAARAIGVTPGTIVRRHIVPNLLGVVVVYATVSGARHHPHRIGAVVPRPRRAGTDDELGRADPGRRAEARRHALAAAGARRAALRDALLRELRRRWPARRARPEGPLTWRYWKSTISGSASRAATARRWMPSRACRSRWKPARRSASSANPARARARP